MCAREIQTVRFSGSFFITNVAFFSNTLIHVPTTEKENEWHYSTCSCTSHTSFTCSALKWAFFFREFETIFFSCWFFISLFRIFYKTQVYGFISFFFFLEFMCAYHKILFVFFIQFVTGFWNKQHAGKKKNAVCVDLKCSNKNVEQLKNERKGKEKQKKKKKSVQTEFYLSLKWIHTHLICIW